MATLASVGGCQVVVMCGRGCCAVLWPPSQRRRAWARARQRWGVLWRAHQSREQRLGEAPKRRDRFWCSTPASGASLLLLPTPPCSSSPPLPPPPAAPDVYKLVDAVKASGGRVSREAGPVKGGKTVIAFVDDPTGYKVATL